MNSPLQRSIKTRVTLFTFVIVLLGIWSLDFYTAKILHNDMQRLLGEQQFATASYIAAEVNQGLSDRLQALEKVAARSVQAMQTGPAAIQKQINDRPILQELFNGGITVYGPDGTAIADFPLTPGRIGVNYIDFPCIAAALTEGQATIDRPVIGRKLLVPVVRMAAPIRDAQGQIIGALAGVINLTKPNFLDRIPENLASKSGGYLLLISPQHQMIVSATDRSQIMAALPALGNSPGYDRFMQGYEGSLQTTNFQGIDVLASAKSVPVAGWLAGHSRLAYHRGVWGISFDETPATTGRVAPECADRRINLVDAATRTRAYAVRHQYPVQVVGTKPIPATLDHQPPG